MMRSWEISSGGRFITGVPVSASTRPSTGTVAAKRATAWVRLAAPFLQ